MITELSKHRGKELIPTSEMLDVAVPIVLVNKVMELVAIQKLYQLSEDVF